MRKGKIRINGNLSITVLCSWLLLAVLGGMFHHPAFAEPAVAPKTIEKALLALINTERESNGLHSLTWNNKLYEAALGHSLDMASKNYFSHESLDGRTYIDRIKATGYSWNMVAENIGAGQTTAQDMFNAWKISPGHYKNMMNPNFCEAGIGYATATKSIYKSYWTIDLGRRPSSSRCAGRPRPTLDNKSTVLPLDFK